jgi:hypothetical protein
MQPPAALALTVLLLGSGRLCLEAWQQQRGQQGVLLELLLLLERRCCRRCVVQAFKERVGVRLTPPFISAHELCPFPAEFSCSVVG